MAKDAIEVVKRGEIVINPKTSEAEYFQWLENIQDWCISRQLWWGIDVQFILLILKMNKIMIN